MYSKQKQKKFEYFIIFFDGGNNGQKKSKLLFKNLNFFISRVTLVINIILDCPGVQYCPKYRVQYEGNTIVEGNYYR